MSLTVWLLEDNRHLNLFWGYHEKIKITGFEMEKAARHERSIVPRLAHIHIHHSCWIHKGNKPIGTYTSPDLQLQLGPEERWVNFSTLCLVYWYSNRVGVKTGGSASQYSSSLLCRSTSFSLSRKTLKVCWHLWKELQVPYGRISVPFSISHSWLKTEDRKWWKYETIKPRWIFHYTTGIGVFPKDKTF